MMWWLENKDCTGCGACTNICENKAITLQEDEEGFIYPVIDNEACVNCGLCKMVCPVEKQKNDSSFYKKSEVCDVYAGWSTDKEVRILSTSGGVFSVLAERTLKEGGLVTGVRFNDALEAENVLIESLDDLAALRKSKYIQSNPKDIYKKVKEALDNGKKVMFCGTPCQVAAVKAYIGDNDNLLTVDFVCRNTNSLSAYRSYIRSIGNHKHADVIEVVFRDKDDTWQNYSTKLTFDDGTKKNINRNEDPFMRAFILDNLTLRPSCEDCKFRGFDRGSDITLGDYWGVRSEWDDKCGTSLVIVHTKTGEEVLNAVSDDLVLHKSNKVECEEKNKAITDSVHRSAYAEEFYKRVNAGEDFMTIVNDLEEKELVKDKDKRKVSVYIFGDDEKKRNKTIAVLNQSKDVNIEIIPQIKSDNEIRDFLHLATGNLISIIDAGDYVHDDMYKTAFKEIEKGADVVIMGLKEMVDGKPTWPMKDAFKGCGNATLLYDSFLREYGRESAFTSYGDFYSNKVFRRSVFDNVEVKAINHEYVGLSTFMMLIDCKDNIKKVAAIPQSYVDKDYEDAHVGNINCDDFINDVYNLLTKMEKGPKTLFNLAVMRCFETECFIAKEMHLRNFKGALNKLHVHLTSFYPNLIESEKLFNENFTELEEYYEDVLALKREYKHKAFEDEKKYNALKYEYDSLMKKRFVRIALKLDAFIKKIKGIFGFKKKETKK
ncbi:MAG: Coenzyme F420 hydrogenase/dehydrogenase, beta subunit C-terminal domain [Lachnospiraceae bacterium]|nr:Coenzyme F420 hydrogenase/dehydrogenase, beta subunit C-terminal domain [Lachnospiraceae bacterium]